MERDPFILTGLMWSWLEQLKEPVISVQQAKDISPYNSDAKIFLNTLGKVSEMRNSENYVVDHVKAHVSSVTLVYLSFQAPKETLICILDCMARMQMIPEEVENAFLNRTIKAFTWVREEKNSVDNITASVLYCNTQQLCLPLNSWRTTLTTEGEYMSPWRQSCGVSSRT